MGITPVTTTINTELHAKIKQKGWAVNDLIELGFETRLKMGQENRKINEIFQRLEDLENFNTIWKNKYYELKRQIEEDDINEITEPI